MQNSDSAPKQDQITLIRQGYRADLSIEVGGFKCPVRILSAETEIKLMAESKLDAAKVPESVKADSGTFEMFKASKLQKAILFAACTIGTEHHISLETLDKLSGDELAKMYDKYRSAVKYADPAFEDLDLDKITQMMSDVKKKTTTASDYYLSDLAAMGRYFLDQLSRQVSAPGS